MELIDKIKGALAGFAFGDALGLGTEFMNRNEIASYYPRKCRRFSDIIRDAHRCQWEPGEWTNGTEMLLCYIGSLLDCNGFDVHHQAETLKKWLDDKNLDTPPVLNRVCKTPGWAEHPISVAHRVWLSSGISEASNEAVHRGLVTGMLSRPAHLEEDTRRITLMTNDDSRCVSSTTVIARVAHDLLYNGEVTPIEKLVEICQDIDPRTIPHLMAAYEGELEDLEIDDEETMMFTRKSMASALWALWHTDNAPDMIYAVVDAGGDADTNAAISGTFAGIKYGYDALPDEKDKMPGLQSLLATADRIAAFITARN